VDAYRLAGGGDLESLGFEEMLGQGAVLIEWADRVAEVLPADRLTVTIEPVDEDRRRFHCSASGTAGDLLERLAGADVLSGPR
jgi:tRNA threonylcarbamoyladenosine biosynthesis protein TsaE